MQRAAIAALVATALAFPVSADGKVATPTLAHLKKRAEAIALVHVDAIHEIGGLAFAEGTVVKGYRGLKKDQRIVYLADRTWVCDISKAKLDETVVLFLEALPEDLHWRMRGDPPAGLREALAAEFGDDVPRFRILVSGRGRLVVKKGRVRRGQVRWSYGASVSLANLERKLR